MSPFQITFQEWERRPRDKPLWWYEDRHKEQGFVFATPRFYVMGRPVRKYAPLEQIMDVEHVFEPKSCDTWFIFQLTGDMRECWSILPWEMAWMAFTRDNDPEQELKFYETRTLMRLTGHTE